MRIPDTERMRCFVEIMNNIFHLTRSEIDILVAFMEFDLENACSTEARKNVMEVLKIRSAAVINNHVKSLKDKQAIIATDKRSYKYNDLLKYSSDIQTVVINIAPK